MFKDNLKLQQKNNNIIATVSVAHLVQDTYSAFLAPILPLLIEKLGMSLVMSAFLDIARKIPSLLNPFFGLLAERSDARYFMLIVLLFIAGITSTLFHIPSPGMIKASAGEKLGRGMSYFMVGGELARTIGPLLITGGVSLWGLEGTWRLMPFGIIASIILYYKLRNFHFSQTKFTKKREKGDAMREVKRFVPLFGAMSGFMFFQSAMKMAVTLYLAVYLTEEGFSLWVASSALAVLQFFGVIGTFLSGNISDKIGRQKTLVIMSSGAALTMSAFLFSTTPYTMFPLLAILGIFMFANGPIMLSVIHELDTKMPTFINSVYMSINFSISSIVVLAMGVFGDAIGLKTTYSIAAFLAYIAIGFALYLNRAIIKVQRIEK